MPAGAGGTSDVIPGGGSWGPADIYIGGLGNIQSYGIRVPTAFQIEQWVAGWLSDVDIPLGLGTVPVQQSSVSVSALDEPVGFYQDPTEDIEVFDRRDQPLDETATSTVVIAKDWFEYWALQEQGVAVSPPGTALRPPGDLGIVENKYPYPSSVSLDTAVENEEMGWLSDTIGDIYGAADIAAGGWLPGGPASPWDNTSIVNWGWQTPGGGAPPPVVLPPPGGPVGPPLPPGGGYNMGACGPEDPMKGMVWKKVCGQYRWVKQKRRRRKALATKGDISQLSALKGVLGTGKAFEVWIATHS